MKRVSRFVYFRVMSRRFRFFKSGRGGTWMGVRGMTRVGRSTWGVVGRSFRTWAWRHDGVVRGGSGD